MTHDVFSPPQATYNEEEEQPEYSQAEEDVPRKPLKESDILDSFHHVFIPEVVREPRIHFVKVPRLGSYMAVPLVYNSCLNYESLEAALQDHEDVTKARSKQAYQKKMWAEEQHLIREAKIAAGEEIEPEEEREWESIEFAPFPTDEVKWVVGLDAMG